MEVNDPVVIQAEIDRLNETIRSTPQEDAAYQPLHAAQQALGWAINPEAFASPSATIKKFFGVPPETAS